jgi:hypothetical protein
MRRNRVGLEFRGSLAKPAESPSFVICSRRAAYFSTSFALRFIFSILDLEAIGIFYWSYGKSVKSSTIWKISKRKYSSLPRIRNARRADFAKYLPRHPSSRT